MVVSLQVAAPARAADTITVDFESGPALGTPVTTEYLASAFVQFLAADDGFRPYRRSAPGQARSGTVAADVGYDVCAPETGGGCEFVTPSMTGRLTRTATAVTLHAGLFTSSPQPTSAQLTAYRANNTQVGTVTAPISATGFTSALTVTSAAPDIARFVLTATGPGATNSSLGFDDLTLQFPDNSLPDISLSAPSQVHRVLQGDTLDIPVDITRLNGSNGPATMSVAGLPAGVSAQFLPNPVTGTGTTTTLRLSATDDTPAFEQPVDLTITADPQSNANVAPDMRTVTTPLIVRSNFELSVVGGPTFRVGLCAPTDVPVRVQRSLEFAGTVTLTAAGNGQSTELLPTATIPAGGGLIAERTLRLTRTVALGNRTVLLTATSPGAPSRSVQLQVGDAASTATLTNTTGRAPRLRQPGDRIEVTGSGFCPGTTVRVGNTRAEVPVDLAADGRSFTFRIPRAATSGPVTVVPTAGPAFRTSNALQVQTVRNTDGFAFDNYDYGWLSFGELTDLVGVRDMFIEVNPCWPFYSCPVPTGVPDPVAYIVWGVLNAALRASGGHCFGISRTVQELLAGKVRYSKFAPGVDHPFALPSATGPNSALATWLDGRHAGQGTAQFLVGYLGRERSIAIQLDRIRSELAAGRYPGVSMQNGFSGHVVTAYDIENQPDGSTVVYVYDNNQPFTPGEDSDADAHYSLEIERSAIRIDAAKSRWEFAMGDGTWSGGDSDIFTVPLSLIPDDPSLPGLSALQSITIFGAPSGAARIADPSAQFVPVQDSAAVPGSGGFVVAAPGERISHSVVGLGTGTYSQISTGDGIAAGVRDVSTRAGVEDRLSADEGSVRFSGGMDRPLLLDLAAGDRSAQIETHSFRRGQDTATFQGSSLVYRHDGGATRIRLHLAKTDRRGTDRFTSEPVTIGRKAVVRAKPMSWGSLDRVRLVVVSGGERSTRILTDRSTSRTRLLLGRPDLKGKRVSLRLRVKRPTPLASAGVVLRAYRGQQLVARKAVGLRSPGRGRIVSWQLPKQAQGRLRIVANATLLTSGDQSTTVRKRSQAVVTRR